MPRSRSPSASFSTASLSWDEWLMKTRMRTRFLSGVGLKRTGQSLPQNPFPLRRFVNHLEPERDVDAVDLAPDDPFSLQRQAGDQEKDELGWARSAPVNYR
jgi:hypothetical protein